MQDWCAVARILRCVVFFGFCIAALSAQVADPAQLYRDLRAFSLTGGIFQANETVLKRDRATLTFHSGTFYFAAPVDGQVRNVVFIGQGSFKAGLPPTVFEQENLRRMLKSDAVESDFRTAVLRFTDDTAQVLGKSPMAGGTVPAEAAEIAQSMEPRMLKETGANISARQAVSILNAESPGFFLGLFDKGKRGRFSYLLDYQGRIPVSVFDLSAGEKGMIFSYRHDLYGNDIWMAFYGLADYEKGQTSYSDQFDLVDIRKNTMKIDLRDPKKMLKLEARMEATAASDNIRAIPLVLNEALSEYENRRLKKAMRVKSARVGEDPITVIQEDWDSGVLLLLPSPARKGQELVLNMELEGDFMYDAESIPNTNYPLSNTCWYPRHGYLNRSAFDLTFLHRKNRKVTSIGRLVSEQRAPEGDSDVITQFRMEEPVALATFAVGPFQRHEESRKMNDGRQLPIEYYSMDGTVMAIKEDFILAELGNCVDYFSTIFGPYPYSSFRAAYHPFGFGQGLPTLLMMPATDRANKGTYSFMAHETAHQWWGHIVLWRSYRDQWLSEGFAEYSGVMYTRLRAKGDSERQLIQRLRDSLREPPETVVGIGKGRLTDVGPIIMGHRLSTRESLDAYQTLIYNKGALVLRMLHFLFTDPKTGNGQAFFDMMKDFVKRHANGWASTEDFLAVANEHFPKTPLAQRYQLKDLNWFFSQWVYQTSLPRYTMNYKLVKQEGGKVAVQGEILQEGTPENQEWFMPLPVLFHFGKNQTASGTLAALGPRTSFNITFPMEPKDVELDPGLWVLSEKTEASRIK